MPYVKVSAEEMDRIRNNAYTLYEWEAAKAFALKFYTNAVALVTYSEDVYNDEEDVPTIIDVQAFDIQGKRLIPDGSLPVFKDFEVKLSRYETVYDNTSIRNLPIDKGNLNPRFSEFIWDTYLHYDADRDLKAGNITYDLTTKSARPPMDLYRYVEN